MSATIVVPALRVDPLVERCVAECRRTSPDAEIVVLVDDGEGRERLAGLATVEVTGPVTIAEKRNKGAAASNADHLAFIDSDAYPAAGWLEAAEAFLEAHPDHDAVGGPNVPPPDQTGWQRWIGLAHRSFLVTGWWAFRRDPAAPAREVTALPSCNLVVRREAYLELGGMNTALFTAEDTDFCKRFVARGHRIWFTPDVAVFHQDRRLWPFVIQRFTFGVAMAPLLEKGTRPDLPYTVASFANAGSVLFLAAGPLLPRRSRLRRLWRAGASAFAVAVAAEAVRHADRPTDVPGTAAAIAIGNLAPGVGFAAKLARLSPDLRGVYRNDR